MATQMEKQKTNTLIVEVSPEIYKQIRDNNYRVFIGHQCCRAYDIFNVKPCYKCGRFGHNGSQCKNKETCQNVQKNTIYCVIGKTTKCVNCCYSNSKYNINYNINHEASDSGDVKYL